MAIQGNALLRKQESKLAKTKEIEEQIERLEEDIRKLKIEFDIFFNGGTRKAPHQARASVEARIKRLNGDRELSFTLRFKLQAVMSRYTSYRELWRRKLKLAGEDIY
ncbi:MAG: hypothetical protein ACK5NT_04325 [Pyrinomonadaceae bacterium]